MTQQNVKKMFIAMLNENNTVQTFVYAVHDIDHPHLLPHGRQRALSYAMHEESLNGDAGCG